MKNLSFEPTKENRVHVARRREATKGFWSAGGGGEGRLRSAAVNLTFKLANAAD